jgi:hypothetical protein
MALRAVLVPGGVRALLFPQIGALVPGGRCWA